ncbi:MAG: flagellar basal body rod protein FlgC [Pseudomonadota bacterium]
MSLTNILNISASALAAQSQRLNTVASNLANAESTAGADGQAYRARQVIFTAVPQTESPGSASVKVSQVVEDQSPARRVYEPNHPAADEEGYVSMSNVNVVEEMVNMISASRSYQSNVEVMNTAKNLMLKLLTLGT